MNSKQLMVCNLLKGLFTNYFDRILAFFDHLPPSIDLFYGMNIDKKWTTYLPLLVNIVSEQPIITKFFNIMYFSFRETTLQIVSRNFMQSSDILTIYNYQVSLYIPGARYGVRVSRQRSYLDFEK